MCGEFDAFEPVWLHVIGKHAARGINCDQQIETFAFHILKCVAPPRLRETHNGKPKSEKLQHESKHAPRTIYRSSKLRKQLCRNEFTQPLCAAMLGANEQRNQHRNQQESPKPFWRAETHNVGAASAPRLFALPVRSSVGALRPLPH